MTSEHREEASQEGDPSTRDAALERLGATTSPVLLRLPISQYCRKAEWGLSLTGVAYRTLDVGLPRMREVRRASPVQRTVPVMVHKDDLVHGSHSILLWCDGHRTPMVPSLYPPEMKQKILDWEQWADQQVGPLVRRIAYRVLSRDPAAYGRTRVQRITLRVQRPMYRAVARYLKVRENAAVDDEALYAAVDRVATQLDGTGTGLLFTDHFTGADIATAALMEPLLPVARVWALDERPGWPAVQGFIRKVRPDRLRRVESRRVREKDWRAFEVLNEAYGTLKRPTAAEY